MPLGVSVRSVPVVKGGIEKGKRLRSPALMHEPGRPVAWEAQAPAHCDHRVHLLTCDRINPLKRFLLFPVSLDSQGRPMMVQVLDFFLHFLYTQGLVVCEGQLFIT